MSMGTRGGKRKTNVEEQGDGTATGRVGIGARVRAWWKNPSIMRAFFGYTIAWLVVASVLCLVAIDGIMEVYYRVSEEHRAEHVEVNAGPYIYDAATDELVPATPVYLDDFYDQVVFVAFATAAENYSQGAIVAGGWNRDMQVVNASMELLRSDPVYRVTDWGGNYTEADYIATDGSPYDPDAEVSVSDLPAYDARERAERAQTTGALTREEVGGDVLCSNVAYYVALDESAYLTPLDWGLRIAAGIVAPVVIFGGGALLFFRRFYRRYIAEPLASLGAAADRIAAQDLDFEVAPVRGRELGRLSGVVERMRAALFDAYRELWRTAEDRRRLNAAFAHDLRTPLTVLKGTVEMAQARERAAAPRLGDAVDAGQDDTRDEAASARDESLVVIAEQVERLERYAAAMAQATKLEDRTVALEAVSARAAAEALERQAGSYVASCGKHRELVFLAGDGLRTRFTTEEGEDSDRHSDAFMLDLQVVEEAVGNVLSNACAHAANRIGLTVDVNAAGSLVVIVEDDGPGFSSEALRHGCDAFYSEQKSAEHFGLGLNVASVLARLHGGDIVLANAPGGGALVTMTFAAHRAES
ncbi:HAMP domain-containing sensor histidine kinase [uncultured Enorma sp.]|uniref:HAMP domain-containing sensor histidine kinase n=1 Tax=uncultured Enorma sp. TaxID=1714346 RepID=UPI00280625DD|nr:HAMP domain-containing sensor histidine kinase [uncultured Enorma sp.]